MSVALVATTHRAVDIRTVSHQKRVVLRTGSLAVSDGGVDSTLYKVTGRGLHVYQL